MFRLDAIAFIWKRLGTSCQNQPEVHDLTQALRTVARIACPAVLFKAEAIVGPADLPAYLGVGEHAGKVSDLAYHNGLMVQIWSMLASGDARLASRRPAAAAAAAGTTAWITYARCHDDIGWAIDDDGRRGGRARPRSRTGGSCPTCTPARSPARGRAAWSSRRTRRPATAGSPGSLASLAGLEAGDPDAPRAGSCWPTRSCSASAALPVLWMGDELGLLNDPGWADDPAHAGDNRWVHRPRMPWPRPPDDARDQRRACEHLVAVRARAAPPARRLADRGLGPPRPGRAARRPRHPDGAAAGRLQRHRGGALGRRRRAALARAAHPGLHDAIGGARAELHDGAVRLAPYAAAWLYDRQAAAVSSS